MAETLRALIIEDSELDAALLVRELEQGGYSVSAQRVDTPETLSDALESERWDILFADYTMPRFTGADALAMVRNGGLDVPFVFVSGTIGEDVAVTAMKAGANDYFIKGSLKRLVPAVQRELRDAETRRERRRVESERREAEEALRRSEERHRLLFEHIADVILVLDGDGVIRFVSESARDVLGCGPEELVGRAALDLIHPDDVKQAYSLIEPDEQGAAFESLEVRMSHGDGSWKLMECALRNLLLMEDVAGLVVTCRDITERKRLETEILQAQKLESVGRLAGGIAHDFNNLLTAVMGHANLLLMDDRLTEAQRSEITGIERVVERAAGLTRQMLAFGRRQVLDMRPLDLNSVVSNLVPILVSALTEKIEIETDLGVDLGTIHGDVGRLEQVLMNLAVNARDAMPDGGRLRINTYNIDLDEHYSDVHPVVEPGPFVALVVSDTGSGMDRETRDHIFEPFFTTKEPGRGTGLGLATVYGIVKQSGGFIWVYSEVGMGTTFKIYLPRVDSAPEALSSEVDPVPPPGGNETVLLVEDDETVRQLAARVLRGRGYDVLEAKNGDEALRWLSDPERTIDALLTDAVLPGLGGRELARQATALRPDLPVLFVSGYATPVLTQQGILDAGVNLLEKPFSASSLARALRSVIDRGSLQPDPE